MYSKNAGISSLPSFRPPCFLCVHMNLGQETAMSSGHGRSRDLLFTCFPGSSCIGIKSIKLEFLEYFKFVSKDIIIFCVWVISSSSECLSWSGTLPELLPFLDGGALHSSRHTSFLDSLLFWKILPKWRKRKYSGCFTSFPPTPPKYVRCLKVQSLSALSAITPDWTAHWPLLKRFVVLKY